MWKDIMTKQYTDQEAKELAIQYELSGYCRLQGPLRTIARIDRADWLTNMRTMGPSESPKNIRQLAHYYRYNCSADIIYDVPQKIFRLIQVSEGNPIEFRAVTKAIYRRHLNKCKDNLHGLSELIQEEVKREVLAQLNMDNEAETTFGELRLGSEFKVPSSNVTFRKCLAPNKSIIVDGIRVGGPVDLALNLTTNHLRHMKHYTRAKLVD